MLAWVIAWYVFASAAAACLYWTDKRAAQRGRRRVRERTLHLVELLGGWPGAIAARRLFRHKTRDRGFLFLSYLIIAAHLGAWLWWFAARR